MNRPVSKLPADPATYAEALAAANYDPERLIMITPYTIVVVNRADFPTDHWHKKYWSRPGQAGRT